MHGTNIDEDVTSKRRRKLQLLTRAELDGRTTAAKQFDAIARGIAVDLGGENQSRDIGPSANQNQSFHFYFSTL